MGGATHSQNSTNLTDFTTFSFFSYLFNNIYLETVQWHQWKEHLPQNFKTCNLKTLTHLDGLACMTAIVGEDGRHSLEDFASVSPGHHQAEEAGTGQCVRVWPVGSFIPVLRTVVSSRRWKRDSAGPTVVSWLKQTKSSLYLNRRRYLTQHIWRFSLKALWLLSLEHI